MKLKRSTGIPLFQAVLQMPEADIPHSCNSEDRNGELLGEAVLMLNVMKASVLPLTARTERVSHQPAVRGGTLMPAQKKRKIMRYLG